MKKINRLILISIICCFIPMIMGLLYYSKLPQLMPVHFSFQNVPDNWYPKYVALFILPFILLLAHALCLYCTFKDVKNEDNQVMLNIVIWIIPIISNVLAMILIAYSLEVQVNISLIIRFLIAFLIIILGNYLPKARVSHTIGIRTPWTLKSSEIWRKTHRITGYLWLIGGLVILCTLPFDSGLFFSIILFIIALIPVAYSWYLAHK